MRKLMWFTLGFAATCGLGVYLGLNSIWIWVGAGVLAVAIAVCLYLKKDKAAKISGALLLGVAVAVVWLGLYQYQYLRPCKELDGTTVQAEIRINDYCYTVSNGYGADGQITLEGKTYRIKFYSTLSGLTPGDNVRGNFRLYYTDDDSGPSYQQGKGIFLTARPMDSVVVENGEAKGIRQWASCLRNEILQILESVFAEDVASFARALLLGDTSKLTYKQDVDFQRSGIRHVVAVSGLHVSILFSLAYTLMGKRRWLAALLGIPLLLVFAALAGFTPSITRACIMQVLMILAMLIRKEYDPPTALAFAALVMLVANPYTISSVSFQLSAGCMMGIFLFSQKIHDYLLSEKRFGPAKGKSLKAVLTRWIVSSVSVTFSAMAVTTPLCALYFGNVSLIGIITNLLVLWVISFIFYGIMLACVLSLVWVPLGQAVGWLTAWAIRYVLLVSGLVSKVPFAAVYTESIYIVCWLGYAYILLAIFLFSKKKHPVALTACILAGLCVALGASWLESRTDRFRVSVLDVGQGQAILVQSNGENYLIDCGGDYPEKAADAVLRAMYAQGVYGLDGVILTHYDKDHAAGLLPLLTVMDADRFYLPEIDDDNGLRETLADTYSDRIHWIDQIHTMTIGHTELTLIPAEEGTSDNESSMCILFQGENCDILITGDRGFTGERKLLQSMELPQLEVLVVGHHGSKNSTGLELLHKTRPLMAVISAGADNSYGHPAQETLDRLQLFDCQIWRTDRSGTIIIRR